MALQRTPDRHPAAVKHADHQRLWRMVEGAVADALRSHPEYLTEQGRRCAVASITKRVVGNLAGHAKQTLAGGRLGGCSAAQSTSEGAAGMGLLRPHSGGPGGIRPAPAREDRA